MLVIEEKYKYPKEFPNSLLELRINGVAMRSLDSKWIPLCNLQCLDLSRNAFHLLFNNVKEWRKFSLLRNFKLLKEFRFAFNAIKVLPVSFIFYLETCLVFESPWKILNFCNFLGLLFRIFSVKFGSFGFVEK